MQDYAQACPLIVSCNNMLAPATQQLATPEYSAFLPGKKTLPTGFPGRRLPFLHFVPDRPLVQRIW